MNNLLEKQDDERLRQRNESLSPDPPESQLREEVRRLRELLRRCLSMLDDFGIGDERRELVLDLQDELAKE
jgi:hypothetical protein